MSVVVEAYEILERNASKLQTCSECEYIAVWVVTEHLAVKPRVGYTCGVHIDTVIYRVDAGLLDVPETPAENGELG